MVPLVRTMILTILSVIVPLAGSNSIWQPFLSSDGVVVVRFSTESLILAQDERWRRA